MLASQKQDFFTFWIDSCASQNVKALPNGIDGIHQKLESFDFEDIKTAMGIYLGKAAFAPKAYDILHILKSMNPKANYPGADEAWAMCAKGDESATVVCFNEMLEAESIANECLQDLVATRMAFKSSYDRIVEKAINEGRQPNYRVSLGHNIDSREGVVIEAVRKEYITADAAHTQLAHIPLIEFQAINDEGLTLRAIESKKERLAIESKLENSRGDSSAMSEALGNMADLLGIKDK